jgi:hypothetical protein
MGFEYELTSCPLNFSERGALNHKTGMRARVCAT